MKSNEMAKLKSKSKWDDDINDWVVPPFSLKGREVALPSLSIKKQAQDYMEAQKNERDLVMEGESSDDNGSSGQGSYLQQYEAAKVFNGNSSGSANKKIR
jgi:hypothetical protein